MLYRRFPAEQSYAGAVTIIFKSREIVCIGVNFLSISWKTGCKQQAVQAAGRSLGARPGCLVASTRLHHGCAHPSPVCLANGAVNLRLSVQGSFGVEERGSPGLRETAKALGLPDPDDDDANTLSSPESGPWSPHGEDEPQTNWKQRQEEGWAVRQSPTLDRHSLVIP